MTAPAVSVQELKQQILPDLFAHPAKLGEYGDSIGSSKTVTELSVLMERGSVGLLATEIASILSSMAKASPEKISKKPSWMDRLLGGAVERQVMYQAARQSLDRQLAGAEGLAQGVRDTVNSINFMIEDHVQEAEALRIFIQAGREFLDENPHIGVAKEGELTFDRPRERLARKLANMATLLASHELSINQMKLSRAQALDMLDRFREIVTVLLPVWRQHTLTLLTTKNMSPEMVESATAAHRALMNSLSESLNGIRH